MPVNRPGSTGGAWAVQGLEDSGGRGLPPKALRTSLRGKEKLRVRKARSAQAVWLPYTGPLSQTRRGKLHGDRQGAWDWVQSLTFSGVPGF